MANSLDEIKKRVMFENANFNAPVNDTEPAPEEDPVEGGVASVYIDMLANSKDPTADLDKVVTQAKKETGLSKSEVVSAILDPSKVEKRDILKEYGVEGETYDQWDWLRDVGYSMASNSGTGILDSFAIGAKEANTLRREASTTNNALKNKLKLAEVDAKIKADKAAEAKFGKTITVFNPKTGRDENLRSVRMGTPGAIGHPYNPGEWVVVEPKKPTGKGSGSGSGGKDGTDFPSEAQRKAKADIITSAMQGVPEFGNQYDASSKAELKKLDAQIAKAQADNNPDMMTALEAQKLAIFTEKRGHWEKMEATGGQSIMTQHIDDIYNKKITGKGLTYTEKQKILTKTATEVATDLGLNTEYEKSEPFKYDPRFTKATEEQMTSRLGDLVGLDLEGATWNWDATDLVDSGVSEESARVFRQLSAEPAKANRFKATVAARMQEYADSKGLHINHKDLDAGLNDIAKHALGQLYGNSTTNPLDGKRTSAGGRPRYDRDAVSSFIPEPSSAKGKYPPGVTWRNGEGGWGYYGFPDGGWVPASKFGL